MSTCLSAAERGRNSFCQRKFCHMALPESQAFLKRLDRGTRITFWRITAYNSRTVNFEQWQRCPQRGRRKIDEFD
jgi:hypothetical protein